MTRPFAAVLLAAILGMALVAPVAGDEPFGSDCPVLALAFDRELRNPPPGFTERQWAMLWELARCFVFIDDGTFGLHDDVIRGRAPDCNLFEYLEGIEVAALVCD